MFTPVGGTIVAINDALGDSPEHLNSDPYGAWLFKVRASGAPAGVMDAAAYAKKIG